MSTPLINTSALCNLNVSKTVRVKESNQDDESKIKHSSELQAFI